MRIGIDVKCLSRRYTGVSVYVSDIIHYFAEIDTEDEFFLYSNKQIELPFHLPNNFHVVLYKSYAGTIGMMTSLPRILRRDMIEVFWGTEHCLPLGKQKFRRVLTIHDLAVLSNYRLGTRYNYMIQRFLVIPSMKCADTIIAISKSTAKDVSLYTHKEKIQIVYNGDSPYTNGLNTITAGETQEVMMKFQIRPNQYFLFVSTIEPRKNINTIIDGFNKYKTQNNSDVKIVLAGGLGWRYSKILKHIKESPYVKDIVLTGYCSNLEREVLYRKCICLVFPSLYEGFGFPVLEAMSVGKPVIISNTSSLPEVGGDIAYYINDVYDSDELSKKIKVVAELSEAEKEIISRKSIQRAKSFSRRQCAEETLKILKNNESFNCCK